MLTAETATDGKRTAGRAAKRALEWVGKNWRGMNPLAFARERVARMSLETSADWWYMNPGLRAANRSLKASATEYAKDASPKAVRDARKLALRRMEATRAAMRDCWIWNGKLMDGKPPPEAVARLIDEEMWSHLRAEAQGWAEDKKNPRQLDALLAAATAAGRGALSVIQEGGDGIRRLQSATQS